MRTFNDRLIVLRLYDLGEADRIAVCLAEETGKISCVAKGARKSGSRFSGSVSALTSGNALLHRGASMYTFNQFEITDSHLLVKSNLLKQSIGLVIAEAMDAAMENGQALPQAFLLINQALTALGTTQYNSMVLYSYLLHLLALSGFQPELTSCVCCGNRLPEETYGISPTSGGVICSSCRYLVEDYIAVDPNCFNQLQSMLHFNIGSEFRGEGAGFLVSQKTALIIEKFYEIFLGRRLKSLVFLKNTFA